MSTRCNVLVRNLKGEVFQYYHHCDGYVNGVGKELLAMAELSETMTGKELKDNELVYKAGLDGRFYGFINSIPAYEFEGDYIELHGDVVFAYLVDVTPTGIKISFLNTDMTDARGKEYLVKQLLSGVGRKLKLSVNVYAVENV